MSKETLIDRFGPRRKIHSEFLHGHLINYFPTRDLSWFNSQLSCTFPFPWNWNKNLCRRVIQRPSPTNWQVDVKTLNWPARAVQLNISPAAIKIHVNCIHLSEIDFTVNGTQNRMPWTCIFNWKYIEILQNTGRKLDTQSYATPLPPGEPMGTTSCPEHLLTNSITIFAPNTIDSGSLYFLIKLLNVLTKSNTRECKLNTLGDSVFKFWKTKHQFPLDKVLQWVLANLSG